MNTVKSLQIFALKSSKIVDWGDSVFEIFLESIKNENFEIEDDDVITITSKIYSMEQKAAVMLKDVIPSEEAIKLAEKSTLNPSLAQLVLNESKGEVYGAVYKAILAKTDYGLSANAGIDQSNCPEGYALLLPRNPDNAALEFKKRIKDALGKEVAVIITDSRTIPLKKGTSAVAIGVAGIDPIIDEKGKRDLYGYKMMITTRALADNLSTATNLLMGETDEKMPFGIIRGLEYARAHNVSVKSTLMPENYCLYFAPLLELINKTNET